MAALISFFLSPFVVHHLGNAGYGIWALTGALTGYLGLLDLGVRGAVTRYVAKFHALSNHEDASRVVSSAMVIFLGASVLAITLGLVLGIFGVGFFHIPDQYKLIARLLFIVVGFNVAVSLVSGVFGGVVVALQRFDLINVLEVASMGFRAGAIVLVLSRGSGLVALALVHLAFAILTGFAYASIAFWLYPALRIRITECDRQHLVLIFSFSAYSFLLNVSTSLVYYSDSVVISTYLPVSAVTFFAIAGNLIINSRALVSGISTTVTPMVSALEARGQFDDLKRMVLKGTRYSTLVVLPIAIVFIIRGGAFIGAWMGTQYREVSSHVLWILSLALIFSAANQAATSAVLGLSKHKMVVPVVLSEALCNLIVSIVLVRSMGIVGVAWGTSIPNLVVSFFFWPWYLRRTLGVPVGAYAVSTWVRPCLALVPFSFCSYAIDRLYQNPNLRHFFLQVVATLPVALLGIWFIGLAAADRRQLLEKVSRPMGRVFGWTSS